MITPAQLVIRECANHDNKNCFIMDKRCRILTGEKARCQYFEEFVLPLEPELQAVYMAEIKAEAAGYELTREDKRQIIATAKPRVKCIRCEGIFDAESNRQKYCPRCRKTINREQTRKRVQKLREVSSV
jgi:uncharacterized paraquat-inducible protein A